MIIHYNDAFKHYNLRFQKPLSYMEDFTFVPVKITKGSLREPCIFQTPLLFSPYGIQTRETKQSLVLSFMNRKNDPTLDKFYEHLRNIYKIVNAKYGEKYRVNAFLRETMYGECLRLKVSSQLSVFDQTKTRIPTISSFSYGCFLINLHGLWISDKQLWFQWYLVQAKIIEPIHASEYLFIDEPSDTRVEKVGEEVTDDNTEDKYQKMLKMGVPKEAVDRQRSLDLRQTPLTQIPRKPGIPAPPPLPIGGSERSSEPGPKITSTDLQKVVLKSISKPLPPKAKVADDGYFEPPSLASIQTMLKRLKPIS